MRINPRQAGASDSTADIVEFPRQTRAGGGIRDVERINQFEFFELGRKLQRVREFSSGDIPASEAFFPVWDAFILMDNLAKGKPLELGVSRGCAATLRERLDGIVNEHYRQDDGQGGTTWKFPNAETPPIPAWRWNSLITALDEFEMVFREEMREAATYRVPDRGIFHTGKLVDTADQSFPADLFALVPDMAREDWRAAGRCLAFNLLSASGFHVARAVEATVESYYRLSTGKTNTLKSWNDYIKALEAALASPTQPFVPSEKVISELRQMKDDYRNPIMHPRVVLSDADALMLFANGQSVIIAMAQEMKAAQPAPASTLLGGLLAAALQKP